MMEEMTEEKVKKIVKKVYDRWVASIKDLGMSDDALQFTLALIDIKTISRRGASSARTQVSKTRTTMTAGTTFETM